ncbi:MAG: hypothetical protein HWE20_16925 [Gammaproteobacteria bacterium]|nr:hypothetical protein [Gammaproteobacteria bacterium]
MNRAIANAFGGILNIIHVLAALGLAGFVYQLVKRQGDLYLQQAYLIFGAVIAYIVVMGTLCTLVSINSYLREMSERADTSYFAGGSYQIPERIEPEL